MAFHLLSVEEADAERLGRAIIDLRKEVKLCIRCFNVTGEVECSICRDMRRNTAVLCVVERAQDIAVLEKTREFDGPISRPRRVDLADRRSRAGSATYEGTCGTRRGGGVEEIIAATNPTVEGDTTALYLARLLKPLGAIVTRLASGLPVGGDLDYADEITLGRALAGRQEM